MIQIMKIYKISCVKLVKNPAIKSNHYIGETTFALRNEITIFVEYLKENHKNIVV